MNNSHNKDTVNLFWTGGWDSTFRLLQLLLVDKMQVQPYYIIDLKRESFHAERTAMKEIRSIILLKYPLTEKLLFPTIFKKLRNIVKDQEITSAYLKASQQKHIGSQYEWLARFCKHHNIYDMELCCQKAANPNTKSMIAPYLRQDGDSQIGVFNRKYKNTPEYKLFNYYRFPLLYITKKDMLRIARENGWEDIMDKTWFCHHPKPGIIPCGKCDPCQGVISEYLEFRILVRSGKKKKIEDIRVYGIYRKVNNYIRNFIDLYE